MQLKENTKDKVFSISLLVLSVLGVIAGILAIVYACGISPVYKHGSIIGLNEDISFGTEYYTYTYHAMAMAGNSAYATFLSMREVQNAVSSLLIVAGIVLIAVFGAITLKNVFKVLSVFGTAKTNSDTVEPTEQSSGE